jgi:hypothetical protein
MKILAIEHELPGATVAQFQQFASVEARRVWELVQQNIIREANFRADRNEAVLTLECDDIDAARSALASLPLVHHGLIEFELIPLAPYPGFGRLFAPPDEPK